MTPSERQPEGNEGMEAGMRPTSAAEYRMFSTVSLRWISICMAAGEVNEAERCRADADLYSRMADGIEQRRAA